MQEQWHAAARADLWASFQHTQTQASIGTCTSVRRKAHTWVLAGTCAAQATFLSAEAQAREFGHMRRPRQLLVSAEAQAREFGHARRPSQLLVSAEAQANVRACADADECCKVGTKAGGGSACVWSVFVCVRVSACVWVWVWVCGCKGVWVWVCWNVGTKAGGRSSPCGRRGAHALRAIMCRDSQHGGTQEQTHTRMME